MPELPAFGYLKYGSLRIFKASNSPYFPNGRLRRLRVPWQWWGG